MEYITLMGTEEVSRAGGQISGAAVDILRAANTIYESVCMLQETLKAHRYELENIVDSFLIDLQSTMSQT